MAMFNKMIKVKLARSYTLEELDEIFKEKGHFDLPFEITGKGPMKRIEFVLDAENAIWMQGGKKKIDFIVQKRSVAKQALMSAVTDGWSEVLDNSGRLHHEAMEKVIEEVKRIVEVA